MRLNIAKIINLISRRLIMFNNKIKIIVLIILTLSLTLTFTTEMKAEKRTVVDMMGREVKIPEKVERVTKINPKINELPNVGSKNKGVNIESIMELNPDLVIMFPHGDGIETADRLKELGIATLVINP